MPYTEPHEKVWISKELMQRIRVLAVAKQSNATRQVNYLLEKALAEEEKRAVQG